MLSLALARKGCAGSATLAAASSLTSAASIEESISSSSSSSSSSSVTGVVNFPRPHAPVFTSSRVLLKPKTVKSNPFSTQPGKFDQSFEKMVGSLEQKLPFRQHHLSKGYIYDRNFGEENMDQMKEAAKHDVEGREPERPAAQQARSYFTDQDLSPEAMHVRSPKLKVAQQIQRQRYDRKLLKTTDEPAEYYYPEYSIREKQLRNARYWAGWSCAAVCAYWGWRQLARYMREDYDPIVIGENGQPQVYVRK